MFYQGRWVIIIQLDRKQQLIILLLAGLILLGGGYRYGQIKERAIVDNLPQLESATEVKPKEIQVHVVGAVVKPGVYKLPQGARVVDAVNLAVPQEGAEPDALKLASLVNDGQTVNVPFKVSEDDLAAGSGVITAAVSNAGTVAAANSLVNINTADISQLDTLPGIGPALAERIIDYREVNGQFTSEEEIKKVSGIGDKKFQDLKDKITVH